MPTKRAPVTIPSPKFMFLYGCILPFFSNSAPLKRRMWMCFGMQRLQRKLSHTALTYCTVPTPIVLKAVKVDKR